MFERFTRRARRLVNAANRHAKSEMVKTHPEHVFCAINEGSVAGHVLKLIGIDLEKLQQQVIDTSGPFEPRPKDRWGIHPKVHYAPSTISLFQLAEEIALSLEHKHVGDEHLLLAAFVIESRVAFVLKENGVEYEAVSNVVHRFFDPDDPENRKSKPLAESLAPRSKADRDLGVEIYVDPGDASAETIRNVLTTLSDLHIAAGGYGLKYVADDLHVHIVEGVQA
jgi:ATP-dependent Clp protease ATP-binding subunit ClpA